jgi:hypothetical protein
MNANVQSRLGLCAVAGLILVGACDRPHTTGAADEEIAAPVPAPVAGARPMPPRLLGGAAAGAVVTGGLSATAPAMAAGREVSLDHAAGNPALAWQHTGDGSRVIWQMNGTSWEGAWSMLPAVSPEWRIVAAADFNGNGQVDLLWYNETEGATAIWLMAGHGWTGGLAMLPVVPAGWQLAASVDFSGDGRPDLVWQHPGSGQRAIWLMEGTAWGGKFAILPNVPTEWRIAAAADFNHDGHADLVWQNLETGARLIWEMNGTAWTGKHVALPNVPVEWQIAGAGDFDDDGSPDLVWQNVTTGERAIWLMAGMAWSGTFAMLPQVDPVWQIGAAVLATALAAPLDRLQAVTDTVVWFALGGAAPAGPALRALDGQSGPVARVTVRFNSVAAVVANSTALTDAHGVASGGAWQAPPSIGGFMVTTDARQDNAGNIITRNGPRFGLNVFEPLHLRSVHGAMSAEAGCGLDADGRAVCWSLAAPLPQYFCGAVRFEELAAGYDRYGRTADGSVYFIRAGGADRLVTPAFTRLVSGQQSLCGLDAAGTAHCWGRNQSGQTGSNPFSSHILSPTPVHDAVPFVEIAAGWEHACGLTGEGAVYCWGRNDWGQVGDGTQTNQWSARRVGGSHVFASLALGNRYSCALDRAGQAFCWGREFVEFAPWELPRLAPVPVANGMTFVQLAAGGYHTCGLVQSGEVFCWGLNSGSEGTFGDGTTNIIRQTPGRVAGGHRFSSISASWKHTCGITAAGTVCWGLPSLLGFPGHTHPHLRIPVFATRPRP